MGHDLLNDPKRAVIAVATVPAKGVVIAGPLKLVQSNVPVLQGAIIARLAINMNGGRGRGLVGGEYVKAASSFIQYANAASTLIWVAASSSIRLQRPTTTTAIHCT